MTNTSHRVSLLRYGIAVLGLVLCSAGVLWAQGAAPETPEPSSQPLQAELALVPPAAIQPNSMQPSSMQPAASRGVPAMFATTSISGSEHKFWDKKNTALFAASAAFSGADFAVTRANLNDGGQELNPVVRIFGRSSAGLAVNFAGETAGVIAISYFFHRTGHHRLERLVSVVNMSASAFAVSYGMAHR